MSAPAQQLNVSSDTLVPLRRWIEGEVGGEQSAAQQTTTSTTTITNTAEKERRKEMILGKTTVAYGIAELLRRARSHPSLIHTSLSVSQLCSTDNFEVREEAAPASGRRSTRRNVKGVHMLSPQLSVNISEPSFLSSIFASGNEQEVNIGRYLEVEFSSGQLPLPDLGDYHCIQGIIGIIWAI